MPGEPMMPAELAPDHPLPPQTTSRDSLSSLGTSTDVDMIVSTQSLGVLPGQASGWRKQLTLGGVARRTLGISLLLLTVFLWTLSNFLASVSPNGAPRP
jgi:solute carrier family 35, member F5